MVIKVFAGNCQSGLDIDNIDSREPIIFAMLDLSKRLGISSGK